MQDNTTIGTTLDSDGYHCGECGRVFKTVRALGGHARGHAVRNKKSVSSNAPLPPASVSPRMKSQQTRSLPASNDGLELTYIPDLDEDTRIRIAQKRAQLAELRLDMDLRRFQESGASDLRELLELQKLQIMKSISGQPSQDGNSEVAQLRKELEGERRHTIELQGQYERDMMQREMSSLRRDIAEQISALKSSMHKEDFADSLVSALNKADRVSSALGYTKAGNETVDERTKEFTTKTAIDTLSREFANRNKVLQRIESMLLDTPEVAIRMRQTLFGRHELEGTAVQQPTADELQVRAKAMEAAMMGEGGDADGK